MVAWRTLGPCSPHLVDEIRVMGMGEAWKVVHKAGNLIGGHLHYVAPEAASEEQCAGLEPESWCCSVILCVLLVAQIRSLGAPQPPNRPLSQQLHRASWLSKKSKVWSILEHKEFVCLGNLYSRLGFVESLRCKIRC